MMMHPFRVPMMDWSERVLAWLSCAGLLSILALGMFSLRASGDDVPDFMRNIIGNNKPASPRTVAEKNVLALDTSMMDIYEDSLAKYKRNMRSQVPIILALFSEGGGRMILHRPGHEPIEAAPVPIVYQLAKSVSHSSMAIYQIVAPYLANPSDTSWHAPMQVFRVRCQTARASLEALELPRQDRDLLAAILDRNLAFMDECLANKTFTADGLEKFTHATAAYFGRTINIAAHAQVSHWMSVIDDWKKQVGEKDWPHLYAASNSIYVTRQNNILFTVLAQFMGQEAIGDRLLLLETTEFTTTPEKMLDLLARIVSDRALGKLFFRDYYLMDAELLGGGARKVIADEATKRGMKPLIPPLAPFHSNDWPWRTDPTKGTGPKSLDDIK